MQFTTMEQLIQFENSLTEEIKRAVIRHDADGALEVAIVFHEFESDFEAVDNGISSFDEIDWERHTTALAAITYVKPSPIESSISDNLSNHTIIKVFSAIRDNRIPIYFGDGVQLAEDFLVEAGVTFLGDDYFAYDIAPKDVVKHRSAYALLLNEGIRNAIKVA